MEHEDVTKGTIEIVNVEKGLLTMKWSGLCNVFWSEEYGKDVPFETTFTVKLPAAKKYKIDAFKTTKTKISKDTTLEVLNLDEFNEEVVRVSNTRQWDDFNTVLKFKVTCEGVDYLGDVVFTNGKLNHVTNFDKNCPRKVQFKDVNFNLRVNYEELVFVVE